MYVSYIGNCHFGKNYFWFSKARRDFLVKAVKATFFYYKDFWFILHSVTIETVLTA